MKPWQVTDLPPALQAQVLAKLAQDAGLTRGQGECKGAPHPTPPRASQPRPGARNEERAENVLEQLGLTVEARQYEVALAGGHRYTADMLVRGRDGGAYLVEVKGPYQHGSAGRSRLAFDDARAQTGLGGIWMQRRAASRGKDEHWRVEVYG